LKFCVNETYVAETETFETETTTLVLGYPAPWVGAPGGVYPKNSKVRLVIVMICCG